MDTLSLVAIAVAAVVAVIGLVRAAGATKELAAARAELAEVKAALQASREELRALAAPKQKKPADPKPPEPAPPKAAQPKPSPPKPEPPKPEPPEPEPPPSEPKLDPEVVKRAEVMLRDARLMARHVGFEAQLEVNGRKGVRVPVEVTTDTDEQAIAHLQSTSDAVLDVGTRNGERFLVVRV